MRTDGESKKVCPLREEPAPGRVVYEKGDYIIHELDGEEHKVGRCARFFTSSSSSTFLSLISQKSKPHRKTVTDRLRV